jgi:hypothetical protein
MWLEKQPGTGLESIDAHSSMCGIWSRFIGIKRQKIIAELNTI